MLRSWRAMSLGLMVAVPNWSSWFIVMSMSSVVMNWSDFWRRLCCNSLPFLLSCEVVCRDIEGRSESMLSFPPPCYGDDMSTVGLSGPSLRSGMDRSIRNSSSRTFSLVSGLLDGSKLSSETVFFRIAIHCNSQ